MSQVIVNSDNEPAYNKWANLLQTVIIISQFIVDGNNEPVYCKR